MTRKEREAKTLAAIEELDLRKPGDRKVAQLGVILIQMLRLGWEAKAKPDTSFKQKWQTPPRERWKRP